MNAVDPNKSMIIDKTKIRYIIFALAVLAVFAAGARLTLSDFYSSTDSVWRVSVNIQFDAEQTGATLKLGFPQSTTHANVIKQSLHHPHTSVRYLKNKHDGKTTLAFYPDKTGLINIDAEFWFHLTQHPRLQLPHITLNTDSRALYLNDRTELDISNPGIANLLLQMNKKSDNRAQLIDTIYRYARNFIILEMGNTANNRVASELLNAREITPLEQANLFIALARAARIPARLVTGFILAETPDIQPHHWAQLYIDDNWQSFDLVNGYKPSVPYNYIPFRYNNYEIFSLYRGKKLLTDFNLVETSLPYSAENTHSKNLLNVLSLSRLSQDVRNVFSVLFLLPLGILITVIFRHYIGIHNYGVFAPALLALALTRNDFFITSITLGIVIFFVLIGRKNFPKKIHRTPRLAIIFTLVILSMGFAVSIVDYYLALPEGYAVLLPVVILSSLIDNIYKTLDTLGKRVALVRLFWTAIITLFCIPVLHWTELGHVFVQFPELHLLTLALILLFTSGKSKRLVKYIPPSLRE